MNDFEQASRELASAFNMPVDEAAEKLHKALQTYCLDESEAKRVTELMKCPWWKFWNGWFTRY